LHTNSQKPDEVRERIVQLMGDLPRIELFARKRTPGWDVWGNEVEALQEASSDGESVTIRREPQMMLL
jgi:site-specific DNA-methyltransferase (adenine-specific)